MKTGYGRIAVVLDRSGSMETVRQATVDGYNEFINGQRLAPGTADVLLAQFDDEYEVVYDKPLSAVPLLTVDKFVPRGNTALMDAIGRTIVHVGADLSRLPEDERPDSVTIVILTDGHENASQEYKRHQIATMVKHQTEIYNWKFVYLGANQDAVLTAAAFNIPAGQAMSFAANTAGTRSTMMSATVYTVSNRLAGAIGNADVFTEDDRLAAMDKATAKEKKKSN